MLNQTKNLKELLLCKGFLAGILLILATMLLMTNNIGAQPEKQSEQEPVYSFENGLAYFKDDKYDLSRDFQRFQNRIYPAKGWWKLRVVYLKSGEEGKELRSRNFEVAGIDKKLRGIIRKERIFFKKLEMIYWNYNMHFYVISDFIVGEPDVEFFTELLKRGDESEKKLTLNILDSRGWKPSDDEDKFWFHFTKRDWEEVVKISEKLGEVATEYLVETLSHSDENLKENAAFALGVIKDSRAIEPLIKSLRDKEIRREAVKALVNIGKPSVEPLIKILIDKNESGNVRGEAAWALGELGDSRAIDTLLEALLDKNEDVRQEAARALGKIKDPKAINALIDSLQDEDDSVRKLSVNALKAMGWEPSDNIDENAKLIYYYAKENWEGMAKIGEPAVEFLTKKITNKNEDVRKTAIEALGNIKHKSGVKPLINILMNKREPSYLRWYATDALRKIGDLQAVEPLIKVLKDEDEQVYSGAAKALGEIKDLRAVVPLIELLENENKHRNARENAALALGSIGDPRAFQPLIKALENDNAYIRRSACWGLGRLGDKRAIDSLRNLLNSKKEYDWIKEAAAYALKKLEQEIK